MDATLPFEDALQTRTSRPSGWRGRPPRVGGALRVRVPTRRGERELEACNLSLTGVYLTGVKAAVGQVVPLTLTIPELDDELRLSGRVVRCDEEAPGVALTFSRIGWEDMLAIARFLAPRL
ncbi:MAG: PilZ domain-containing protein [Deltaproteobacteria bacterium]|nr:PilZ domain-containing protein [Deltaproteobacteria bacterium]